MVIGEAPSLIKCKLLFDYSFRERKRVLLKKVLHDMKL